MTSRKILTATAILALVAGATAADAAPRRRKPAPKKPVCKVVQDAKDDATETLETDSPTDPGLDIVSADIATDANRITVVWRVSSLAGAPTSWPAGRGFNFQFKIHGEVNVLAATVAPNGNLWQAGKGQGVVDAAKNEIRMTVPIADLREKFKPNERLTDMLVTTWRMAGNTDFKLGRVDDAVAVKPFYYTAAWPSCVRVGA